MPFDGVPKPDLSMPSLENLAYVLRHRETWPPDFEWDYRKLSCCAVGLSIRLWGCGYYIPSAIVVGVRPWRFCFLLPVLIRLVKPEHVADAIDDHLQKQSDAGVAVLESLSGGDAFVPVWVDYCPAADTSLADHAFMRRDETLDAIVVVRPDQDRQRPAVLDDFNDLGRANDLVRLVLRPFGHADTSLAAVR